MSTTAHGTASPSPAGDGGDEASDARRLIAEYDAEKPARDLTGVLGRAVGVVAMCVSLYALYVVFDPLPVLPYRMSFLALVLALTFLVYRPGLPRRARVAARDGNGEPDPARDAETDPARGTGPDAGTKPGRDRPGVVDWALAALSVVVCAYPLFAFDAFIRRTFDPSALDLVMAAGCTLLVLEATRRTVGAILPAICLAFVAYAYYGGYLPVDWSIGHRGYDLGRILVQLYMGTEGLFGVPLDVAATYIVLFTIYGAVLEYSGAGRFFLDISFAAFRRSAAAPGRTVTLAGFLLGTVSGSGTATAVSLGSVAWPILRRAGYAPAQGGGVLAAAGIGAILSPPTLGAAAFIIAEYLKVSYLQVLLYAVVPTLLYYLGIILAVEIDARRFGAREVERDVPSTRRLLTRFGYHFSSLIAIVVLMALGVSPFRAVVYATVIAFALSFLDPERRLGPRRAAKALSVGTLGVLPVAATTAAAGIIVAVVTLTGLGLKASRIIVDLSGGGLAMTAVVAALAVLLLGLAVPVTASFIIAAVIIGPALQVLGVTPVAAYMFIFYYAVLSEVTPPTALAAVAASAITGGNAFTTMMMTWKYTLPAFLVPMAFVLAPPGRALLWQGPWPQVLAALAVSAVAVAALAAATGGWMLRRAGWPERLLCGASALILLYLEPASVAAGLALLAVAFLVHVVLRRPGRDHGPVSAPSEEGS
ncbi:C4-dicarboxylate ABC transporter permease [Sphaerisporangium melleum]|uniref:C4-dicarboxylate ABC transporter permease n=1 Tax=Sphaerisporangium melleum TaxID=321316 RepID=A0A917RLF7_9ACTN|nr:TRAP transporter fused permease subunit [Sphaerisporangium melleum]GGL12344.1 C4-dicarboxylate ABC transporter permease [Sphaerisporangium melleum]GII74477.1 C4-dicarboxylate ABC transporter permease [Sphaerisporangium melleum]